MPDRPGGDEHPFNGVRLNIGILIINMHHASRPGSDLRPGAHSDEQGLSAKKPRTDAP
jgi:hypothetical protein